MVNPHLGWWCVHSINMYQRFQLISPKIVILVSVSCTFNPFKKLWLLTEFKIHFKTYITCYKCMIVWILCYFLWCFWRLNILDMGNLSAYNTLIEGVIISLIKMYVWLVNLQQLYSILVFGVIYLIIGRISSNIQLIWSSCKSNKNWVWKM